MPVKHEDGPGGDPNLAVEHNFVTFHTRLFRDEQPDEEMDRWFLGEDCARWLYSKLLAIEEVEPRGEPFEEDWGGWTFDVRVRKVPFWLFVSSRAGLEGPYWIVRVEPSSTFSGIFRRTRSREAKARLCEAIDSILASTPEISARRWFDKWPSDHVQTGSGQPENTAEG